MTVSPARSAGTSERHVANARLIGAEEIGRRNRRNVNIRALPPEHEFAHQVGLDLEVVPVHSRNERVSHHLHDGEQVSGRLAALRDVRRTGGGS